MVLSAVRGALGFLSTLPVSNGEADWEAFRRHPETAVLTGYVIGPLLAVPLLLVPAGPLAGFGFLLAVFVLTGINHLDGLTDVADGIAVHGTESARVAAMRDSALGVGGFLAGGLVLVGLFAIGQELAGLGRRAVVLVVAGEVVAKTAMVWVVVRGTPRHDGFGSAIAEFATGRTLLVALALALPVVALAWPSPVRALAIVAAIAVALAAAEGLTRLARSRFGGTSGDVLGATNEVARLAALLTGVLLWTLW